MLVGSAGQSVRGRRTAAMLRPSRRGGRSLGRRDDAARRAVMNDWQLMTGQRAARTLPLKTL